MRNKLEKIIPILNLIAVCSTLVVVLVGSILITYGRTTPLAYTYYLIGMGGISTVLYIINKILNCKFSKFEIAMFVLAFLAILSLINAINIRVAIWGTRERYEGILVILSYYATALLASNIKIKKHIKIIIGSILTIGLCNFIYGLMQTGWIVQNKFIVLKKGSCAGGFNSIHMFYGSLQSICYPIVLGLFLKEKDLKKSILLGVILIIFTFATLLSGAMGILFAEIIVFGFAFIKCIIQIIKEKSHKKWIEIIKLIFSIIIFVSFIFIIGNKNKALTKDIKEMKEQAVQITTEKKADDTYGTGRIYIWRNTLPKLKEHFWFGVGIDNFEYAFDKTLIDIMSNGYVDKAHNEYLQIMLCEGVITGILYTIFMIAIGIKNIKTEDNIYYALLLAFACYSIQAFFGISVTRVSPIFFTVVGLLMNKNPKLSI